MGEILVIYLDGLTDIIMQMVIFYFIPVMILRKIFA